MADDRAEFEEARRHGLEARHETRVERAILRAEWRAQVDDEIGGWCITADDMPGTPATGNPPIARFVTEKLALHMAGIHNAWLRDLGIRETS